MKILAVVAAGLIVSGCSTVTPWGEFSVGKSQTPIEVYGPIDEEPTDPVEEVVEDLNLQFGDICPGVEFEDELTLINRISNPDTITIALSPSITTKYGQEVAGNCAFLIRNYLNTLQ